MTAGEMEHSYEESLNVRFQNLKFDSWNLNQKEDFLNSDDWIG